MKLNELKHGEKTMIELGNGYSLEIEKFEYNKEYIDEGCDDCCFYLDIYLNGKWFTNLNDYIFHSDYEITANDTLEEAKQKVFNYLNNKYVGTKDFQGTGFKVGDIMTLKEWKEWAIDDRDMCDDDYGYSLMKRTPLKRIIDLIQDYWEIEIKKVVLN